MADAFFQSISNKDTIGSYYSLYNLNDLPIFKTYLDGYISPNEAALALTRRFYDDDEPRQAAASLWALLEDAIIELSSGTLEIRLHNLLHVIRQLPPIWGWPCPSSLRRYYPDARRNPNLGGKIIVVDFDSLDDFWGSYACEHRVYDMREHWREGPPASGYDRSIYDKPNWREELIRKHIQTCDALAKLARVGFGGAELGYQNVSNALEDSDAVLDVEIPGMEQWLRIIGHDMYQGEHNPDFRAMPPENNLWGEGREMTVRRWTFWKQRLREIYEMVADIKDETRESVKRCFKGMEVIESSVRASHVEDINDNWVHISQNDLDSTV